MKRKYKQNLFDVIFYVALVISLFMLMYFGGLVAL